MCRTVKSAARRWRLKASMQGPLAATFPAHSGAYRHAHCTGTQKVLLGSGVGASFMSKGWLVALMSASAGSFIQSEISGETATHERSAEKATHIGELSQMRPQGFQCESEHRGIRLPRMREVRYRVPETDHSSLKLEQDQSLLLDLTRRRRAVFPRTAEAGWWFTST